LLPVLVEIAKAFAASISLSLSSSPKAGLILYREGSMSNEENKTAFQSLIQSIAWRQP